MVNPPPTIAVPPAVPVLLAFVAGAVDACTVLALFGLYVAQVTGSFVSVGAELLSGPGPAGETGVLIRVFAIPVFFLAALVTTFGVLLGRSGARMLALALAVEMLLLSAFVTTAVYGAPFTDPASGPAVAASLLGLAAMGVQSALVRLLMRGVASTNVMTTNTTVLAIDCAEWTAAAWRTWRHPGDQSARSARQGAAARIAALWPIMAAFLIGCIGGAFGYRIAGFFCLLPCLLLVAGLIVWAVWRPRN